MKKNYIWLMVLLLVFNLVAGGWSVDVILGWFGKEIPFIADTVIGLFVAQVSFPIAVIGKILQVCGVF